MFLHFRGQYNYNSRKQVTQKTTIYKRQLTESCVQNVCFYSFIVQLAAFTNDVIVAKSEFINTNNIKKSIFRILVIIIKNLTSFLLKNNKNIIHLFQLIRRYDVEITKYIVYNKCIWYIIL